MSTCGRFRAQGCAVSDTRVASRPAGMGGSPVRSWERLGASTRGRGTGPCGEPRRGSGHSVAAGCLHHHRSYKGALLHRITPRLLALGILALAALPATAGAAVTSSKITAPTDPSFLVDNQDHSPAD